jgi:hypothetical protein
MGIDYFIQYEPHKAQHFQRKMTKLLANPATLNLIECRSPNKTSQAKPPQFATRSKIKAEMSKFKNCSSEYIKNIIEQS